MLRLVSRCTARSIAVASTSVSLVGSGGGRLLPTLTGRTGIVPYNRRSDGLLLGDRRLSVSLRRQPRKYQGTSVFLTRPTGFARPMARARQANPETREATFDLTKTNRCREPPSAADQRPFAP